MNDIPEGFAEFLEEVGAPVTLHTCKLPDHGNTMTATYRPDWQCGKCGRVWQLVPWPTGYARWVEIQGPNR